MTDIRNYSLQADLALAAYAALSNGNPDTAQLEAIGMSSSQAISFATANRGQTPVLSTL